MTRRTLAQWQALFAEHAASGLTMTAFCRARGINPNYFGLRRKQLADPVASTPAFVPVAISGGHAPARVELYLGGGVTVILPGAVSPRWLAELLAPLRG